ncbi:DUF3748 domain-containing protein [Sphingobacterium sp. DK4209]|uniref:DUF3748 domain-containing protein n=1 Tax=Sphingobacterium zhuxiongii TaxID=2662364 RepID=A0A5Q0QD42_9SPHI|nr:MULTISPECIES: DUF3748 domain-containing protein [unclassified Sphingobacterium]MVZ67630.1 DUF3748 domain-containing protein [Sphingobacterium sp. DK4209]QGA27139.1 DUF3748 domain-containing protein [Sphingobacterium sp. dk4302]
MSKQKQLTQGEHGHTLHHNGVLSKDGQWILFDYRNDETHIAKTGTIAVMNLLDGKEYPIYQTSNQSEYGPGVGAASFNPYTNQVVFIHGLCDADKEKPYDITRRTAVMVDMDRNNEASYVDSRDIVAPYVPGSLRGGTHSHMWSPDGRLLSFTYNDELIDSQLRTVGVMLPIDSPEKVNEEPVNVQGSFYAAIVSDVVDKPRWGTDDINRAFDECWVTNPTGSKNTFSIAFQGNTFNENGDLVTEVFLVDIDCESILKDSLAVGEIGERPKVPQGTIQKRLTYTEHGLSDLRHWLRASPDGQYVYALAKDLYYKNQLVRISVETGEMKYLSEFTFSISSPINLDSNGEFVCFVANNQVYSFQFASGNLQQLTDNLMDALPIVGAPHFDRNYKTVFYNQIVRCNESEFIQIMTTSI